MIKLRISNKAQSMIEYAMVAACVVAALLMMGNYIKRGLGGSLRQASDSIGFQYDARNVTSDVNYIISGGNTIVNSMLLEINDNEAEEGKIFGTEVTIISQEQNTTRTGYERLGKYGATLFD